MFSHSLILNQDIKHPEKDLIDAIKEGNNEAITYLFNHYGAKLMGVCARYAPDHESSKDMFQEGFLKILRVIDGFRYESNLESWLYRIMVNHCVNSIRKRKKDIVWVELNDDVLEIEQIEMETEDPQLKVHEVLELMKQLPYGYRIILNLFAVDGKSHLEISKDLGISVSTSKSQVFKARRALLKLINQKDQ